MSTKSLDLDSSFTSSQGDGPSSTGEYHEKFRSGSDLLAKLKRKKSSRNVSKSNTMTSLSELAAASTSQDTSQTDKMTAKEAGPVVDLLKAAADTLTPASPAPAIRDIYDSYGTSSSPGLSPRVATDGPIVETGHEEESEVLTGLDLRSNIEKEKVVKSDLTTSTTVRSTLNPSSSRKIEFSTLLVNESMIKTVEALNLVAASHEPQTVVETATESTEVKSQPTTQRKTVKFGDISLKTDPKATELSIRQASISPEPREPYRSRNDQVEQLKPTLATAANEEETYKEKYISSCIKITQLVKEKRNLSFELEETRDKNAYLLKVIRELSR